MEKAYPKTIFMSKKPEDNIDLSPEALSAMQDAQKDMNFEEELNIAQDAEPANDTASINQAYQDEVTNLKDQLLRALAEQENTRKRAEKNMADARNYAVAGFAKDLLEVADNLRRALDAVPEDQRAGNVLMEGVQATERAMLSVFDRHGLKQIAPEKNVEKFDANMHEVMFEAPMEGMETRTIIEVLEVGYTLNGRLIRPARVGVVK